MAVLKCDRYPQMQVNTAAGKIRFVEGLAEVSEELAEALQGMAEEYGITVQADPEPEPVELERPAKSASKTDWAAYAVSQGLDAEAADKATRDELARRYADGSGD